MKDCKIFFKRLEELKPYMVKFEENNTIKPKIYSIDCAVKVDKRQSIIVITHDKCTFFANNRI